MRFPNFAPMMTCVVKIIAADSFQAHDCLYAQVILAVQTSYSRD